MLLFKNIKEDLIHSSCLALGYFDGVHVGHQKVILNAIEHSKRFDAISTIVTFENHPLSVLGNKQPKLITSAEKRLEIFEELGIQAVILLNFSKELASMSPKEYLKKILIDTANPKTISIGYNHSFGLNKSGNENFLKSLESEYNYNLSVVPPVCINDMVVSSSVIRKLISEGNLSFAAKMLGKLYSINNIVVKGEQRGRMIGFPTANMTIPNDMVAPKTGVYSGLATIEGKSYKAVVNVGKRPTFGDLEVDIIEAHLLDFNQDIYGKSLEVSFIDRIRCEKKFSSIEDLKKQISRDCKQSLESNLVF